MLKMPEFLKYPEWYTENEEFMNEIGKNDKRYTIKRDAPDFVKKSYNEYLKDILKNNNRNKTIISE